MTAQAAWKDAFQNIETARVADAMHHGVVTCSRDTSLVTVAHLMASHHVHCIVVVATMLDGTKKVCGVVSDRDVLMSAVRGELAEATAAATARTEVLTVSADESLLRAAELMGRQGVTHVVVVDPAQTPIGVLSTLDVAAVVGRFWPPPRVDGATRVEDLMTTPVVTVPPDLPLKDVARILVDNDISGVPVVEGERLLGVVTEADIVARERGPQGRARSFGTLVGRDGEHRTAADVTAFAAMSSPVITVGPAQTAASAATLMTENRVKRLPVVDGGRVVGIVTRGDLVQAFARPDAEIEHDIRENVLVRDLWLRPGDVDVVVDHGRVTLAGAVDSEVAAELLADEVEAVPGVTSVSSTVCVRR